MAKKRDGVKAKAMVFHPRKLPYIPPDIRVLGPAGLTIQNAIRNNASYLNQGRQRNKQKAAA